jgi:hypothetical protein
MTTYGHLGLDGEEKKEGRGKEMSGMRIMIYDRLGFG